MSATREQVAHYQALARQAKAERDLVDAVRAAKRYCDCGLPLDHTGKRHARGDVCWLGSQEAFNEYVGR